MLDLPRVNPVASRYSNNKHLELVRWKHHTVWFFSPQAVADLGFSGVTVYHQASIKTDRRCWWQDQCFWASPLVMSCAKPDGATEGTRSLNLGSLWAASGQHENISQVSHLTSFLLLYAFFLKTFQVYEVQQLGDYKRASECVYVLCVCVCVCTFSLSKHIFPLTS